MATLRLQVAEKIFGRHTPTVHRLWWRLRTHSPWEPNPQLRVAKSFVQAYGLTVRAGPFVGMKYPPDVIGATTIVPRLLGSFELELHPVLDEVLDQTFPTIVNVGCAEGYYAVGLARRLPEARVYAFESDPSFRLLCSKTATLNGVAGRISIRGTATAAGLQALALNDDRLFVICDCEGCELEVIDPEKVTLLRTAHILLELHDFVDRTISRIVLSRFKETHEIQLINSRDRNPGQYTELNGLAETDAALAVAEVRPESMQWAWLKPLRNAQCLPASNREDATAQFCANSNTRS